MAPSRPHHELHADTHLCPETVLPVNLMSELPYSQLRDRTFGSVQQARVVSKGVHCHGNTVTWVSGTVKHVIYWTLLIDSFFRRLSWLTESQPTSFMEFEIG
jgi:hypothetical protein